MKIIITAPSLNINQNVSGVSSVTQLIINSNIKNEYLHFELGKRDGENRNIFWLFRNIRAYLKWICLMFKQKDALIHFNLSLGSLSIIRDSPLILITRLLHRRMIIHLHGGDFLMRANNPWWMNFILKLSFSGKNPIIVLSSLEAEALKRKLSCNRIFVLPNCVELKEATAFNRSNADEERLNLLFLGRIALDKGLEYILLAMNSLKKRGIKFKFFIAGKGPEEKTYVKKFSDLLGEDFEFKGAVSGNEKTGILKSCDIFLLPSFYEGLPMALLESMSFGLVPVTTNVGSIKDVIKDGINGIIVSTHSSEEIAIAIQKLSNDKEFKQKLSDNARQYIFNNYNLAKYISRLNEIYNYE